VLVLLPLLWQGALPSGDDTLFHLQFSDGIAKGLLDGHLYPRWLSEANRGFGSAALINYPPLGGYLVAVISLLTRDLVEAFHLVLILVTLLSGVAFYLCARSFAPPLAAAVTAALYVLTPYRTIDLHARFAFAEVTAFLWLPLLVKFMLDLRRRPSLAGWTGLVVCSAGLLMTHVLTAFMVVVAMAPYLAWVTIRGRQWRYLSWLGMAALAAAGLSAVYLVPLLVERGWTYTEYLTAAWWGDWRANLLFVDPASVGAEPSAIRPLVEFSFWHSLVAVVMSAVILARSRDREAAGFLVVCMISIFLQLPVSAVVWRLVPGLEYLQFPWRFQSVLVLFSCLLIARAATRITWGSGLLISAVAASSILFSVFLWRAVSFDLTAENLERVQISRLVFKEHIPRGVQDWERFEQLPLDSDGLLATSPQAEVEIQEWSSHRRQVDIAADEPAEVFLRTFYFPGWVATLDGEPVPLHPVAPLHAIGLQVPTGDSHIDIRFRPTPVRVLGSILSVLTAGLLLLANLRRW